MSLRDGRGYQMYVPSGHDMCSGHSGSRYDSTVGTVYLTRQFGMHL
jgi:hypothetical protein